MNKEKIKKIGLVISWAMYDLSNQFFALNVVSLYFVRWVTFEKQKPEIFYSLAFGISTLIVAFSGLIMGTVSDRLKRRRPFLVWLTLISIVFTMLLGLSGSVFVGLLFFIIANFGCQTAIVFYNALMLNVAPPGRVGLVSGLGKMFGYSGAIVALYIFKPIVLRHGYQATFFPTGICFLIFSLPCLFFVKDRAGLKEKINLSEFFKWGRITEISRDIRRVFSDDYVSSDICSFFKASLFGLSSVNAIILFMSVYATKVFGLGEGEVINLIFFSTIFAMLGSILSGMASDFLGYKRTLIAVFISWMIAFLIGAIVRDMRSYWFVGAWVGATLGATWVVSRALAFEIAPQEKIGEVFGIFNFVGYISAILGAVFWGLLVLVLSRLGELGHRITLLSLNLFMLLGFVFLLRISGGSRKNNAARRISYP